jgi:PncC family amidohydrolase
MRQASHRGNRLIKRIVRLDAMHDAVQQLMDILKAKDLSVVTAESCTAGLIACTLSRAAGAGEHFHGGYVAYTKAHKHTALGVDLALMEEYGAASETIALLLATNALERSLADLAVAATGVAGPAPDDHGVAVGTLYIATAARSGAHNVNRYRFTNLSPEAFCARAVNVAIAMLRGAAGAVPARSSSTR